MLVIRHCWQLTAYGKNCRKTTCTAPRLDFCGMADSQLFVFNLYIGKTYKTGKAFWGGA